MKSPLHETILSRGYWQVLVRPTTFKKDHIDDISALLPLLVKNRVRIRGWDFPHIDSRNQPRFFLDWIEQEFNWEHHKSIWRLYQSGQFFQIAALPIDWRDESSLWPATPDWKYGTQLYVGDTIATLTEIFEFAARLALSEAGNKNMQVKFTLGNLKNRFLVNDKDSFFGIGETCQASISEFPYENTFSRAELISESKNIALKTAVEIFKRFNWSISSFESLRSWQNDFKI
ncbi:MAG: hypothetical protein IPM53_11390 [Anaerolineaceae bacterium]|nr:hypothetical protein [Anaerolineaceae bacterium]